MTDTMIDAQEIVNTSIRDAAMLVRFSASKWSASKNDRTAEHMVRKAAGANQNIGRVIKDLLVGCDAEYKALCSSIDGARVRHYEVTLPWTSDERSKRGPRLLPNVYFMDYVKDMNRRKDQMNTLLDAFLAVYDARVAEAKGNLGALSDTTEYPTAEAIRGLFSIAFEFAPVPEGSDFRGMPKEMLTVLSRKVDERVTILISAAMEDACQRLRENLDHIVERLSDKEKRFHKTLVSNAVEIVEMLKGFNITNSPELEKIRADFEQVISTVSVGELRKDPVLRQSVADEAKRLLGQMDDAGL